MKRAFRARRSRSRSLQSGRRLRGAQTVTRGTMRCGPSRRCLSMHPSTPRTAAPATRRRAVSRWITGTISTSPSASLATRTGMVTSRTSSRPLAARRWPQRPGRRPDRHHRRRGQRRHQKLVPNPLSVTLEPVEAAAPPAQAPQASAATAGKRPPVTRLGAPGAQGRALAGPAPRPRAWVMRSRLAAPGEPSGGPAMISTRSPAPARPSSAARWPRRRSSRRCRAAGWRRAAPAPDQAQPPRHRLVRRNRQHRVQRPLARHAPGRAARGGVGDDAGGGSRLRRPRRRGDQCIGRPRRRPRHARRASGPASWDRPPPCG